MSRLVERVRREPALLTAAAVAVLNLAGADQVTVDQAAVAVETVALLILGLVARSQYTPLANRPVGRHARGRDDDR